MIDAVPMKVLIRGTCAAAVGGPISREHPALGEVCPTCGLYLEEHDLVALVPLGPGLDLEARAAAAAGQAYLSHAALAHLACAGGALQPAPALPPAPNQLRRLRPPCGPSWHRRPE